MRQKIKNYNIHGVFATAFFVTLSIIGSALIIFGTAKYVIAYCVGLFLLFSLFLYPRHRDIYLALLGLLASFNIAKYLPFVTLTTENLDKFSFWAIDVPLLFLFLSFSTDIIKKDNHAFKLNKYSRFACLFGLMFCSWSFILSFFALHSDIAFLETVRYFRLLTVCFFICFAINDRVSLNSCLIGLTLGLFVQSSLAILQALFHDSFGFYANDSVRLLGQKVSRSGGSLNPTVLAQFIGVLAPISLTLAFDSMQRQRRWLYLTCFILAVIASLFTLSRGGWLNLIVSTTIVFYYLSKAGHLKKYRGTLILLFVIAIVAIHANTETFLQRVLTSKEDSSVIGRFEQYHYSLMLIRDHIEGVGLGNFESAVSVYGYHFPFPVHNKFLIIFSETGIIGFSFYIGFWSFIVLGAVKTCRSDASSVDKAVAIGIVGGLIGTFINMQSDIYALAGAPELAMFMVSGIVSAMLKPDYSQ